MIKGLEKFKERFSGLEDQYVLIGGTATYLVLTEAGLEPRATKDLDIVLCLEALDAAFGKAFWEFVKEGGYEHLQHSTGKQVFYRFSKPRDDTFPAMLELFSRAPDGIEPPEGIHLVPIAVDEDVYSLSAILLDTDYYGFLHANKDRMEGLSIVNAGGLIPLKAKAWLDLTERKNKGERVDSRDITKHRSDILRLSQLLTSETRIVLPESIKADMKQFLEDLAATTGLNLTDYGLGKAIKLENIVTMLRDIYQAT
jgi:hypothetical protein